MSPEVKVQLCPSGPRSARHSRVRSACPSSGLDATGDWHQGCCSLSRVMPRLTSHCPGTPSHPTFPSPCLPQGFTTKPVPHELPLLTHRSSWSPSPRTGLTPQSRGSSCLLLHFERPVGSLRRQHFWAMLCFWWRYLPYL